MTDYTELIQKLKIFNFDEQRYCSIEKGIQYSHYTGTLRQNMCDALHFAKNCKVDQVSFFLEFANNCLKAMNDLLRRLDLLNEFE